MTERHQDNGQTKEFIYPTEERWNLSPEEQVALFGDQEKIDIITFDENIDTFIRNALSPAEVVKVEIDKEAKRAKVFVSEDQQSIAIGRGGQNVRLAARLTGYELDIETATAKPAEKKPKKNIEDDLFSAIEEQGE